MPKKIYIKDTSFDPIYKQTSKSFIARTRIFPTILVISGLFILSTQVLLPVLYFKTQNQNNELIDNATIVGRAAGFSRFEFEELADVESTKESTFNGDIFLEAEYLPRGKNPNEVKGAKVQNVPNQFYLTVPKLGIDGALIETNMQSLNPINALGHYPGTELPGENGNAFIFGHSVLPFFFNPNNYKTIFSTLGKLDIGDQFYIDFNNNRYTYVVESKTELPPNKVDPLKEFKPKYLNESTVTLMTCSPPGTKLRRLLINAVMVN